MAKKKIYKHHQRSTLAAAKADAVARELVLAGGSYQAGVKFEDGKFLTLNQTADVRTYGAVADGVTDDSAAFNAAIATGLRVHVPAGTYAIASTIVIANKQGFVMSGDGVAKTTLVWTGAAGGTMVRMRGSWFSKIEGLWLNMNSLADEALEMPCYDSGVDTYVSMFNEVEHVRMDGARTGTTSIALKIGDATGQQLDNLTIKKCFIANAARLVTIQGNVTFHIHFVDCEFSGYRVQPTEVFVDVLDRCGLVYFTGCQFVGSAPTVGIIRRDTISGSVVFNNCETENAGTWFVGLEDSAFANTQPVQMIGCTIGCSADDVASVFSISSGSPTATYVSGDTLQLVVGRMVTGTGIPSNTRITAVDASNNLTLSNNATDTNVSASLTVWPNANVISINTAGFSPDFDPAKAQVTDLSKFRKGKEIWGTGIPSTTVSSFVANTSITLSAAPTVTNSAADIYINGVHYTVGMTAGNATVTCADTTGVANGQRVSGVGIPSTTITALSATTGAGTITLSAAVTATDSAALVHMKPNTIDYQQRGAFMITGGTLSGSVETDAYFGAPGSLGVTGGLVTEIGGRYINGAIAFVTAYASQLHRTNYKGDISFGPHMTIDGSTGNVAIAGYTSIGNGLAVTGGATVVSGDTTLPNNAALKFRNTSGSAVEVAKLDASDELQIGAEVATGKGFAIKGRNGENGLSMAGASGKMTLGPASSTQVHDINGGIKATLNAGNLLGGGSAVSGVDLTLGSGSTSDASMFRHLAFMHGGNSARSQFCTETATGIVSPVSPAVPTAVRIAGLEFPSFLLVNGSDGAGNTFLDLLLSTNSGTPTVVSSATTGGTPRARTYSISSYNLMLAMTAGGTETTYTTNTFWMQMSFR